MSKIKTDSSISCRAVRCGQDRIQGNIYITSPRQASLWNIGSNMPIRWDTANISGNVNIAISYSGGKPGTFQNIISDTANDGSFDWTVDTIPSFNCMLKIEHLSDPSKGTIQGLFTIGSFLKASPANVVLEEPTDPNTAGVSETFRIMLNNDPGSDVTLRLYSSNPGEFSLSPASVTLNSANWNTGAEVTLTPEYDGIPDNDQTASVIVSTVSEYAAFQAKEVSLVRVTVRDTSTAVTAQSVFPAYGTAGSPLDITVRGTNFSSTTPVYIYPEGGTPAAITLVTVLNDTTLQVTVPAQAAGDYHLKVSESVLKNALTFATASTLDTKKAIVVAGSGPYFDNSLWNATEKCVNKAYQTLAFQGYFADNINFLSRKLWADVTGNGENDIDADATKANFENAVKTWAANNTDELLIYMTGPGGDGSFQFGSNAAPDNLTAATLDSWLDTLQSAASCKVIVIYDACQSGSFLSPLAGENRILITSATADQRAWFLDDGEFSFSFRLFDSLFHNADLIESFKTAKNNTGSVQMPLIEWSGDGIPDTFSAGRSDPETIIIGRGRVEDTYPPEIGTAFANPAMIASPEKSSTLSASGIKADNGLSRVWARIIPPLEKCVSPGEPVIVLPTVKLLKQSDGATYQNSYEEFTQQGYYNIFVYAKDLKDFQSLPRLFTVNQSDGTKADPGDVNADGTVTLADAILVLKLMAGKNVTPAPGSDINEDNKTEMADAVFILQKVAGTR
ncbi:MAG: C13 family peptidase [Desulfococcaceae bacterium]